MEILISIYEFLTEYWNYIISFIAFLGFVILSFEKGNAKILAINLVKEAEKNVKVYVLKDIDELREWVYNWYDYLIGNNKIKYYKKIIKLIISKEKWKKYVDKAIDKYVNYNIDVKLFTIDELKDYLENKNIKKETIEKMLKDEKDSETPRETVIDLLKEKK